MIQSGTRSGLVTSEKKRCSASACSRDTGIILEFEGEGRREARCASHGYPWLGGNGSMPSWVESVYLRGVRTPWRRH